MHLFEVWRILKIWRQSNDICRCGLFHSAYSNSYVNLAIFDPKVGRETLQGIAGDAVRMMINFRSFALIWTFLRRSNGFTCSVPLIDLMLFTESYFLWIMFQLMVSRYVT